jgi:acyl-coenzyme A synthetase/AMP-(fatty) acid ligase
MTQLFNACEYLLDSVQAGPFGQNVYPTTADSPAFRLYTSGTTGRPKAAMHRHGSIPVVCETYGAQVLGITPQDRCLSASEAFFAAMLRAGRPADALAEVEARLLAHEAVVQAAVVAAADADGLERLVAFVVDAYPTTATGKVRRLVLREMADDAR